MKIEFYDKRTNEIVSYSEEYFINVDGDVYENDFDKGLLWCAGIGWRVVE